MRSTLLTLSVLLVASTSTVACGSGDTTRDAQQASSNAPADSLAPADLAAGAAKSPASAPADPASPADGAPANGTTPPGTSPPGTTPASDPGPKPTAKCSVTKDANGFFTRASGKSNYVAFVPSSYDGTKPVRLLVGLHGCGDAAMNFATWAVNPYDTRPKQDYIGISIDGASNPNSCWNKGGDDEKVYAAIADISSCFWVHQKEVVLAGYSSGGELAYHLGLTQASRFAGILIENSGLYAASNDTAALVAGASWKINVAHRAHASDGVFPLAQVQADWARLDAAGFPLQTSVVAGDHNGTNTDWSDWLAPKMATWMAP